MKATRTLQELGQSLWLDNVTRSLLSSGTLQRYIDQLSVTGLTSNPTIFDHAIRNSSDYDADIARNARSARSKEDLFFDLALADLGRAAKLFQPIHERTDGVDGWVSLEVSPLLAHDTARTVKAARDLSSRCGVPNLFIKIPGTREGLPAIEAAIFEGVPVNVTLLFSREQYLAAADAYLRGIERRIEAGRNPEVASVASIFVSRWDVAVGNKAPRELANRSASQSRRTPTRLTASCSLRRASSALPTPVLAPSVCYGLAPAPRTPRPPTRSMSRLSPHLSRSIPCPRAPSRHSPTTASQPPRLLPMAATARPSWPASPRPVSTSARWRSASKTRAPHLS
jgi:transaldolase